MAAESSHRRWKMRSRLIRWQEHCHEGRDTDLDGRFHRLLSATHASKKRATAHETSIRHRGVPPSPATMMMRRGAKLSRRAPARTAAGRRRVARTATRRFPITQGQACFIEAGDTHFAPPCLRRAGAARCHRRRRSSARTTLRLHYARSGSPCTPGAAWRSSPPLRLLHGARVTTLRSSILRRRFALPCSCSGIASCSAHGAARRRPLPATARPAGAAQSPRS